MTLMTPGRLADAHEREKPGHWTIGDATGYVCTNCVWTSHGEDKRVAKANLCRTIVMLGGHEFICISVVHDDGKKADQFDSRGRPARWRRHGFVRRYPYGDH